MTTGPPRHFIRSSDMASTMLARVPFNRPHATGSELTYIHDAFTRDALSGNNVYGRHCAQWLESEIGANRAFMTPSCSAALEMSARLAGIGPGGQGIMASFPFFSTPHPGGG